MKIPTLMKLLAASLLVAGIASCERVTETQTETKSIKLGGAESVEVSIQMGAGELNLQGGAADLMEGTFRYNVERWAPEVDYSVSGKVGRLTVRQRRRHGLHFGSTRNTWDIRLDNRVPLDMAVHLGAGESDLDLRDFALKRLQVDMGVGELALDLSGEPKDNLDVKIDGGIGHGTIYLPESTGVRADIEGGIGSINAHGFSKDGHIYTNDAYGKTPVSINLRIEAGIGSIDLRMR
jgi:hypothetical protein